MNVIALGIDVVELSRVRAVYDRFPLRFIERVYTRPERERALSLADPVPSLAGRFAAKEAILKALGTGLSGGISWQDLLVVRLPSGAPRVYLRGRALERAVRLGVGSVLVSISHGREVVVAQAMALAGDSGDLRPPPGVG